MNSPRRERPRELDRVAGWFGVVGASGRGGPPEGPVGELVHRPLRVLLEPVVMPALRGRHYTSTSARLPHTGCCTQSQPGRRGGGRRGWCRWRAGSEKDAGAWRRGRGRWLRAGGRRG